MRKGVFRARCGHSAALLLFLMLTQFSNAQQDKPAQQYGFISCAPNTEQLPVFKDACTGQQAGQIACREKVDVVAREGAFFKVRATLGTVFVGDASISKSPDKFVAIDFRGPKSQPDCAAAIAEQRSNTPGKLWPRTLYSPAPEYSEEAREAKLQGTVVLAFTVGVDGRARDIEVQRSLGKGLDEQALATLKTWRWDPAREDGKPVPIRIHVEMNFRLH